MPMPRSLPRASDAARRAGKPAQSAFSIAWAISPGKSPLSITSPRPMVWGISSGPGMLRRRISSGVRPISRAVTSTSRSIR